MKALVYHENKDEQMVVKQHGPSWQWSAGEVIWDERIHGPLQADLSDLGGYSRKEEPHPSNPSKLVYSLEVDETARDAQVARKAQAAQDRSDAAAEKLARLNKIQDAKNQTTIVGLKESVQALIEHLGLDG